MTFRHEVRVSRFARFGLRPLEGYGTTECAPVVAMSTPAYRAPGVCQIGHKRGSVGRPLPGIAFRIVDPETSEPLPAGEPGMLLVSGPNVMDGYLGRKDLTDEVLRNGWYVTGDIANLNFTTGFESTVVIKGAGSGTTRPTARRLKAAKRFGR